MPGERLILNALSESSGNAPLELIGPDGSLSNGITVLSHDYPPPARETQYASSADTEGDPLAGTRYTNRIIGIQLRVAEAADSASTNLATNPVCAAGTTGWTNSGMTTMSRSVLDQTGAPSGLQGAETALRTIGDSDGDVAYLSASVTSGTAYYFSAYVYLSASTATGVKLTARNASGTLKASSTTLSSTGGWQRLSVAVTADSSSTWRFGVEQVGSGATTAYTTLALLEASSSLGAYFSGDTPGCSWSGARHDSASTRPASGGPRFYAIQKDLQSMVDRLVREGGTLKRVPPGAKPMVFDIVDAEVSLPQTNSNLHSFRTIASLTLTCKPFYRRGEWLTLSDRVETSAACLTFTENAVEGEVPALAKLLVDEDQGVDQRWLAWGIESRNYSADSTASPFLEAEACTLKSSAALATRSGSSGAATNNVVRHTDLVDSYQQLISTQATGGGSHLSHVGNFRVFARVFDLGTNTGTISVRLEWGQGDFRRTTQNDPAITVARGDFELVDLGVVTLEKAKQGTQRWEGRVLAKSTTIGDELDLDYLWLVPVDDGSGEVTAKPEESTSISTLAAYDTFSQAAGALAGKTPDLPSSGGNWVGAGDADDFQVSGASNYNLTRTAVSDSSNVGRLAVCGASSIAGSQVSVNFKWSASTSVANNKRGVLLRYVDSSNFLMATLDEQNFITSGPRWRLVVRKSIGGTRTQLAASADLYGLASETTHSIVLSADASGSYVAVLKLGSSTLATLTGSDSVLATAGTLATGKGGIYDEYSGSSARTRTFDNFSVEQTASTDAKADAAIFASQSLEIRSDAVVREDSTGSVWSSPGLYEGDLIKLPVASRDSRSVRFTLKAARYGPGIGADSAIDDISAQVSYQPRGITVPGSAS